MVNWPASFIKEAHDTNRLYHVFVKPWGLAFRRKRSERIVRQKTVVGDGQVAKCFLYNTIEVFNGRR